MTPMPVVKLTWSAPDGPWGFEIFRAEKDTILFEPLAKTNDHLFRDRSVFGGARYFYRVRSFILAPDGQILVSSFGNTALVDLSANPSRVVGVIAGRATDDTTGEPIQGIAVRFLRQGSGVYPAMIPTVYTDETGQYKAVVDTGTYIVRADPPPYMPPGPPGYVAEWYDDVADMKLATPLRASEGTTVFADFGLSRAVQPIVPRGVITGTVVDDTTGAPIPGIIIRFYPLIAVSRQFVLPTAIADERGIYRAAMDTGMYLVRAEGRVAELWPGYEAEWFDDVKDIRAATPVAVKEHEDAVAGFGLSKIRRPALLPVDGKVTDTVGAAVANADVIIMRSIQEMTHLSIWGGDRMDRPEEIFQVEDVGGCRGVVWKGVTDAGGHFQAYLPSGGSYIAMAVKRGYIGEYYNEKPNPMSADVITLDGPLSGIDFTLAVQSAFQNSIRGAVRDALGNGVPSRVILFPVRPLSMMGSEIRFGHTDSLGVYTIKALRAGRYRILAFPFQGYAPAFYKAEAYGVMRWQDADTVVIAGDVDGITIGVVPLRSSGVILLKGWVRTEQGEPLGGVRVLATSPGGEILGFALTDAAGGYAMEGLVPGSVMIVADREGFLSAQRSVDLPPLTIAFDAGEIRMRAEVTAVKTSPPLPEAFRLHQNYPNPFNPATTIPYDLPAAGTVRIAVYNVLGQEMVTLVNGWRQAGRGQVVWDGKDRAGNPAAAGLYLVRFTVTDSEGAQRFSQVRKIALLR